MLTTAIWRIDPLHILTRRELATVLGQKVLRIQYRAADMACRD